MTVCHTLSLERFNIIPIASDCSTRLLIKLLCRVPAKIPGICSKHVCIWTTFYCFFYNEKEMLKKHCGNKTKQEIHLAEISKQIKNNNGNNINVFTKYFIAYLCSIMFLYLAVNSFLMQSRDQIVTTKTQKAIAFFSLALLALKMSHKCLICLVFLSCNLSFVHFFQILLLYPWLWLLWWETKATMTKRILNLILAEDDHF